MYIVLYEGFLQKNIRVLDSKQRKELSKNIIVSEAY
jgi:hypothetical protein